MAMKNSFAALQTNRLTRNFGGTVAGVAEPLVTGYHFVAFTHLPKMLPGYAGFNNNTEIANVLSASCLSATPPGGTLGKVEFTGLGGVKWAVPGNIDYGNSFSVKFLEFSGTPILNIMHGWIKMIRDYRTGLTDLTGTNAYSKSTYSSLIYYWTTAPNLTDIEYYACYDGCFPLKDPQDLYGSDVETVGRLDPEIEFSLDYIWHEDWVKSKCQVFANNLASVKETVNSYGLTNASAG